MRILLDTNVLIAAFLTRGICNELLEHCLRHHQLINSEFLLNEFHKPRAEISFCRPGNPRGNRIVTDKSLHCCFCTVDGEDW